MNTEQLLKQYQYFYTELEPDENGRRAEVVIKYKDKEYDRYITHIPDGLFIGGSDFNTWGGRVYFTN